MNRGKQHFKQVFNHLLPLIIRELWDLLGEEDQRIWTRQWMLKRSAIGATNTLFKELKSEDPAEFRALLRLDVERFETLLDNIAPHIQRTDTVMREAIPARVKLQIALTYLATGMSYRYLQAMFRTSRSTISNLIPEVMGAIIAYLDSFIKVKYVLENNKK